VQQIIYFFIRNKNFLFFILFFGISIALTVRSHSYHNSIFLSSANAVSGNVYSAKSNFTHYFGLEEENEKLVEENIRLRMMLENLRQNPDEILIDTTILPQNYSFIAAQVRKNDYAKTKNYITISKGRNDGVLEDRGVISPKGIIGIVSNTSKNFATVQSILNTRSQINAKLKKSEHFGSLIWDTKDPNVVQLIQIPRIARITIGDTIVTGGKSTIFPKGILIGKVENFSLGEDDSYTLDIRLFNDMTSLRNLYVIESLQAAEILELERETENGE